MSDSKTSTTPTRPPATGGGSGKRMLIGAVVLLVLNYVFNELMDESGLFVTVVTGTLPTAQRNPIAIATFKLEAGKRADAAMAADSGLKRAEVLQLKEGEHVYAFVAAHRREAAAEAATAAAVAAGVEAPSAPQSYRTVLPERARWRQHTPLPEEVMHDQVGHLELLVQHTRLVVAADQADAIKQSWIDLGYNSLGETGVVRCDLLQARAASPYRHVRPTVCSVPVPAALHSFASPRPAAPPLRSAARERPDRLPGSQSLPRPAGARGARELRTLPALAAKRSLEGGKPPGGHGRAADAVHAPPAQLSPAVPVGVEDGLIPPGAVCVRSRVRTAQRTSRVGIMTGGATIAWGPSSTPCCRRTGRS